MKKYSGITIVGAGIAGLTTGIILNQNGIQCQIFEAAEAIRPVGAGIILANNAMQVYEKYGLRKKLESQGNFISSLNITDAQLRNLSKSNLSRFEQKYSVKNIAIHRSDLLNVLADEFGRDNIHLNKRLNKIVENHNYQLTFEDGSLHQCSAVIAADGIKSVVRNLLFEKSNYRDAHQICWRGISNIDLPHEFHHQLTEAWGKGARFGFVKINSNAVYWYALKNKNIPTEDLSVIFDKFHPLVNKIIGSTKANDIIKTEIFDLEPIHVWTKNNVCLIGDAAHATTPNLGQGACQGIEDAYVLGKLVAENKYELEAMFEEYQRLRMKKAHTIVNTSWRLGKIAHLENEFSIKLRNTFLKFTPQFINDSLMESIFDIKYSK
ncbi:MAG: FAD-dependent monooxygenase [Saprospiraceae bacterium]|nr:FAD-dependent monooxygenase [Saprospiraceae bacterium]